MSVLFTQLRGIRLTAWVVVGLLNFSGVARLGVSAVAVAQDNVWSVRKLNDTKPWERFVDAPMRIEGRLGSSGGGQFRLLRCDARFTIEPAKLKLVPAKSTVEVKGRFKRDGQRIDFVVDDLKVVPDYLAQFDSRANKLLRPTPEEWTELGNWAADRARFYEDEELQKKANDAYLNAIDVEYKALNATDADGRFALAKKINEQNLSKRRAMELNHEGLQIQWLALQKNEPVNPAVWQRFATTLTAELPGAKEPLKNLKPELKQSYEQNPVVAYDQAADDVRNQLHRLFFIMVTRKILLFDESDGHDGDAIADQIDKLIPEEHALAEQHRLARLAFRLSNVARETRTEIENLATLLRQRNRAEDAKQALRQWIRSHETRLKDGGVLGRLQLADEYMTLLNDEPSAVQNLKEAYAIEPNFEAVKAKLVALGYRWDNVRWTRSEDIPIEPGHRGSQLPTEISTGMTANALRTRMGQPTTLVRAVTARGITEVWCFGPKGGTRLIVRLEQKSQDLEPKVSEISQR